jgi:hypothetical protein
MALCLSFHHTPRRGMRAICRILWCGRLPTAEKKLPFRQTWLLGPGWIRQTDLLRRVGMAQTLCENYTGFIFIISFFLYRARLCFAVRALALTIPVRKRRPHNLTIGRLFDHHILDMFELSVDAHQPMSTWSQSFRFPLAPRSSPSFAGLIHLTMSCVLSLRSGSFPIERQPEVGLKPCFLLMGDEFQTNELIRRLGNLIVDFHRGTVVDSVNLAGLSHVICLFAVPNGILL